MNSQTHNQDVNEQILQEHEELREMLGRMHRLLTKRAETVATVAEQLDSLCDHVQEHFIDEEDGGFFDQISEQAPRLTDRSKVVRDEHTWLLSKIREIKEVAETGDGSDQWWEQLEKDFHDFSRELMHHENQENELLQAAYNDDIGAAD